MVTLLTDSTIETEVFTQIPFSLLSSLQANPTHKTPKLLHDIAIFHRAILNETYGRATFIESMLATFRCVETFHHGPQCPPPKFVFLQTEPKPPWKSHDTWYTTMSLEDKTRFQAWGIDTIISMLTSPNSMHTWRHEMKTGYCLHACSLRRSSQQFGLLLLHLWSSCVSYFRLVIHARFLPMLFSSYFLG